MDFVQCWRKEGGKEGGREGKQGGRRESGGKEEGGRREGGGRAEANSMELEVGLCGDGGTALCEKWEAIWGRPGKAGAHEERG